MIQTWDASRKTSVITLSASLLVATQTAVNANACVYGTKGVGAGNFYWENVGVYTDGNNLLVGVGNTSSGTSGGNFVGIDANSVGWQASGGLTASGANAGTWASWTSGSRTCLALSLTYGKLWGRVANGNWNNDVIANQDPGNNIGGYTLAAGVTSAPVLPGAAVYSSTIPDSVTVFFAQSSWSFTPPGGFGPFDPDAWPPAAVSR